MTTEHELKTWPLPFNQLWLGNKTHEIRKADRDFALWARRAVSRPIRTRLTFSSASASRQSARKQVSNECS